MKFDRLLRHMFAGIFSLYFCVQGGSGPQVLGVYGSFYYEPLYTDSFIEPLIGKMENVIYDRLIKTAQQIKESGVPMVRIKLNQVIPNFEQNIRATKKALEASLQYVNSIIEKLEIPEKMSLPEAELQVKHLENEIKKLEDQRNVRQKATTKLGSMTPEQIREEVKLGKIAPSDLTDKQIEEAYGIAEEAN